MTSSSSTPNVPPSSLGEDVSSSTTTPISQYIWKPNTNHDSVGESNNGGVTYHWSPNNPVKFSPSNYQIPKRDGFLPHRTDSKPQISVVYSRYQLQYMEKLAKASANGDATATTPSNSKPESSNDAAVKELPSIYAINSQYCI